MDAPHSQRGCHEFPVHLEDQIAVRSAEGCAKAVHEENIKALLASHALQGIIEPGMIIRGERHEIIAVVERLPGKSQKRFAACSRIRGPGGRKFQSAATFQRQPELGDASGLNHTAPFGGQFAPG